MYVRISFFFRLGGFSAFWLLWLFISHPLHSKFLSAFAWGFDHCCRGPTPELAGLVYNSGINIHASILPGGVSMSFAWLETCAGISEV